MRSFTTVLLALAAFLTVGCGTIRNLAGGFTDPDSEPRIYGGLIRDSEPGEPVLPGVGVKWNEKAAVLFMPIVLAELGLTFVGDTMTLPITIVMQECRNARHEQEKLNSSQTTSTGADH
jgi:hypothetical protein